VIGTAQFAGEARFATNEARVTHRDVLVPLLAAAIRHRHRDELLAALELKEVPAGPVNSLAEVFADPQVIARGMRIDFGQIPSIRTPIIFSDAQLALSRPAPRLGEHTAEVLRELGRI
jgi:crotonobetainyl-CoA:carnitine CoA-transferase CaiB-like acyl-CoA transferase